MKIMTGLELVCTFSLILIVILIAFEFYLRNGAEYIASTKIPGEYVYPIVGNLLVVLPFLNSPELTFQHAGKMARLYKRAYRFYMAGFLHYWPIRACEIEFILNSSKHIEKSGFYKFLLPIMGDGLLCSRKLSFKHAGKMARLYKRAYRFYIFGVLHYWPIRASEIDFLMNSTRIEKSGFYKFLLPMMGDGLLCSSSKKWLHRRKILTPAFHFNILQQFLTIFKEESHKFVDGLKNEEKKHETDLHDIISRFTLNNICETAMGVKLNSTTEPDNYREMIYRSGQLLFKRYINPIYYNDTIFSITGLHRELQKCVKRLHDFSRSVIKQRRQSYQQNHHKFDRDDKTENIYEKTRYAMLDTLLEAESNGGQIDEVGIQEEVDTFMFEGYDTTSAGILFCLFMIATHQDAQQGIYEEILEIFEKNGSTEIGIHDYSNMKLMDRVIKESLRLYPPVPYISRQLNESVDLGSVELPRGTQIHIFIHNLHRDPEQFPDPEKFDPDRFLPENAEKRHPFAYIPFSAGPRNCIGQKFAMLEMKTLITSILYQYRLEAITKVEDIVLISDLVLRTKEPIKIKFIKRSVKQA